jgi:hypothetical protein
MVLRMVGSGLMARLMQTEGGGIDTAWLLYGPEDPDVVEPAEPAVDAPWLLAAE